MLNFHTGSYILDILDKENISKKELANFSSLRIMQDELLKWQGAYDKQKEEEKENVL